MTRNGAPARSAASEREAQSRANLLHSFGTEAGDSSSKASLRDGNKIVKIDCTTGFHAVLDFQYDLGGHVANR